MTDTWDIAKPKFDSVDIELVRCLSRWRFTSALREVRPDHPEQVKVIVGALASGWGDRGLSQDFESEAITVRAALEWVYLLLSDVPVSPLGPFPSLER